MFTRGAVTFLMCVAVGLGFLVLAALICSSF